MPGQEHNRMAVEFSQKTAIRGFAKLGLQHHPTGALKSVHLVQPATPHDCETHCLAAFSFIFWTFCHVFLFCSSNLQRRVSIRQSFEFLGSNKGCIATFGQRAFPEDLVHDVQRPIFCLTEDGTHI